MIKNMNINNMQEVYKNYTRVELVNNTFYFYPI